MFKLILIEEIKRKSIDEDIKTFYSSLPEDELRFQLVCVDATLSRGSLPLAEKFLLIKQMSRESIDRKLQELSDYDFYFTTDKIYNHLINKFRENKLENQSILQLLNDLAISGELDSIVS